ncbi:hypothetical protein GTW43_05960, partial [Streptomyces sp. SID5785]|uniref:hypothetical protein n=1 Tax=Streptomyces sp. SID5785 TaxID=2690309 RepID=UPI00136171A2
MAKARLMFVGLLVLCAVALKVFGHWGPLVVFVAVPVLLVAGVVGLLLWHHKDEEARSRRKVAESIAATGGTVVDLPAETRGYLSLGYSRQVVAVPCPVPDTRIYLTESHDWVVALPAWSAVAEGRLIADG